LYTDRAREESRHYTVENSMYGTTKHLRRAAACLLVIVASACSSGRDRADVDSSLARDLALASRAATQPQQFQDTVIAPVSEVSGPKPVPRDVEPPRRIAPPPRKQVERQQPRPDVTLAAEPTPEPQVPAAAPAAIVSQLGTGTNLTLASTARVCTATNRPGDKFVATVTSAAYGTNGAEIPAGTRVVIEVASIAPGTDTDQPQITFRIRSIVMDDRDLPATGEVVALTELERTKIAKADPNGDKKKVIGGAIAGAILGQMMGKNTKSTIIGAAAGAATGAVVAKAGDQYQGCLPDGSPLRLTLSEPLVLARG
jgi:hypothetical protein